MSKELKVNDDEETALISKPEPPKIPFYNTDEYWAIYIGLFSFVVVLIISYFGFNSPRINTWTKASEMFSLEDIIGFPILMILSIAMFSIQHLFIKKRQAFIFYVVIFLLTLISGIIGNHHVIKNAGFGTSVWCIILGVLFRNLLEFTTNVHIINTGDKSVGFCKFHSIDCSKLQKSIMSYELLIKISVVLLAIDMQNMLEYGVKGLAVSWAETLIIIGIIFTIGYFLIDKDTAIVVACGVSVCGSSAATAIADVIKFDKNTLAKFIAIMSVLTIPVIPSIPLISEKFNLSHAVEGAWIGGSVDSTGAVMACANLGGTAVLHVAIVIKMLQNILIGPLALAITMIWSNERKLIILWDKFPKFVLGFLVTSLIVTFLPVKEKLITINNSFVISEWFSSLSFVLIGFDINLKIISEFKAQWKVLILYVIGQSIDLLTTLGVAYLMFEVLFKVDNTVTTLSSSG